MTKMADVSQSENASIFVDTPSEKRKRALAYRLFNIIILGISFMLIFSAFQTSSIVEQIVIKSAEHDANTTFTGSGYASLSIIYATFSTCNWIAPSIIAVIGLKITMLVGGMMYCLFILSFLKLMTWALYLGSVLVGFGAAILWTAQGSFLTVNSDTETVGRNSGVFWAIFQSSLLIGNVYTYFTLHHHHDPHATQTITPSNRLQLYAGLTGACVLGVLCLLILRTKPPRPSESVNSVSLHASAIPDSPLTALKRSFELFLTKDMLLLSVNFAYTGFELTFWSGVYGTCIGNNTFFQPGSAALVGIVGIFIGIGEILGGAVFGLFGKRTVKNGREQVVCLGYVVHMIAFFLIFMNTPDMAPLSTYNQAPAYITSNKYVTVLCGFLLGFGDASFNTQIYTILASLYPNDSTPAFALFKFVQSVAAAVGFAYSIQLLLKWQLLILVVMGTAGTLTYFTVEWSNRRQRQHYEQLETTATDVN